MELLQALHDSSFAAWLRGPAVYPFVNAAHILSLSLVVGAIATLDLRLLGLFRGFAVSQLGPPLSRMAMAGVALALATGFCLFSVKPISYAQNAAFLAKLALVGAAIANALVLQALPHWRMALGDGAIHPSLKISAALSLALWAGAVIAGRWIAFVE